MKYIITLLWFVAVSATAQTPINIQPGQCVNVSGSTVCAVQASGSLIQIKPVDTTRRFYVCRYGKIETEKLSGWSLWSVEIADGGKKFEVWVKYFAPRYLSSGVDAKSDEEECEREANKRTNAIGVQQ